MHIPSLFKLVSVLITGPYVGDLLADTTAGGSQNVKDALVQIAKNDAARPASHPYLDEFLDTHSRPKVTSFGSGFFLNVDSRYGFQPQISTAPFSSTGEPWPMPKHYISEKESVLELDISSFNISIIKKSCDILVEAITRYYNIIKNHIPEEQYNFVYNFNAKTFEDHVKEVNAKYKTVNKMPYLKIYLESDNCGYPDVEMIESYNLTIRPEETSLVAEHIWGVLRGLETFSQLLFKKTGTDQIFARVAEIYDEPRFPHRGILVDTSRHFVEISTLKDVLDGMTYNKMNVLHWHIVDDNSCPYQSEVFPKLSEKGAYHPTLVYSRRDIEEIVVYARFRGIRVIPEFDSPGHTFSWLGYPEIKSTCYVEGKALRGPIGPINPAQDETYTFMAKLFSEIYDVFPDNFVHLGGDELHDTCWATNPSITAYLQEHGNISASEAQSNALNYVNLAIGYYFKRLIETLKNTAREKKQTKSFILWEDVLKNTKEVPAESILQVWMGQPSNVLTLNQQGYRALYSTCWYLDSYMKGVTWQGYYTCEPSPYQSEAEEKGKLLGGEACLWAEYITTDTLMTFMWPRALAPAERLWSPRSANDILSAQTRIQEQRCRMIYRGLPTGHISGPDYCLRPNKGGGSLVKESMYMGGIESSYTKNESQTRQHISLVVLSRYSHFLPVFNLFLSFIGIYLVVTISIYWRKRKISARLVQNFNC